MKTGGELNGQTSIELCFSHSSRVASARLFPFLLGSASTSVQRLGSTRASSAEQSALSRSPPRGGLACMASSANSKRARQATSRACRRPYAAMSESGSLASSFFVIAICPASAASYGLLRVLRITRLRPPHNAPLFLRASSSQNVPHAESTNQLAHCSRCSFSRKTLPESLRVPDCRFLVRHFVVALKQVVLAASGESARVEQYA